MRKILFAFAVGALVISLLLGRCLLQKERVALSVPPSPQRIISLAPSVTETLYALGAGDRIAGVTTFCAWPKEVSAKPKVAEYSQLNVESLVRAMPDLAVVPADKPAVRSLAERMGIPVLSLTTWTIDDYLADVKTLGAALGAQQQAAELEQAFRTVRAEAARRGQGKQRPRVLFSVMRSEPGLGYITEINAVGNTGFFSELLKAAGGENVYQGSLPFPKLSREAILFLNPDIIVDIIRPGADADSVRKDWNSLQNVRAIREGRLLLLSDTEDTVPGPRSVHTLSRLSHAFYPAPDQNIEYQKIATEGAT